MNRELHTNYILNFVHSRSYSSDHIMGDQYIPSSKHKKSFNSYTNTTTATPPTTETKTDNDNNHQEEARDMDSNYNRQEEEDQQKQEQQDDDGKNWNVFFDTFYGFLFPKMAPIPWTSFLFLSLLVAIPYVY